MAGNDESWDRRAEAAGIEIPPPLPAHPLFPGAVIDGTTVYTSGIVAVEGPPWKLAYAGSVGDDIDIETAKQSAALAMVCTLANLKGALGGSLDRVDRFVKVMGFVRCRPEFTDPPAAVNGASEVLAAIFGDDRLPARSAIGVASLPGGASVEIDTVVRLRS
jgi:enamine deaminase RidA (YjgF/YER057c/UK114 family)